ncbi:unnamed protein product [Closterium sp. NIES-54]
MRVSFLTLHLLVLRPSRGEVALGCDVLEDRQEELECLAAAAPHLATMLLAPEGDPDALDIPTPCSYREVILGIEAAALGASESALPGTTPAEALHTFTLDSGASRCFFRSLHLYWSDWLTPQGAQFFPVPPLFSRVRRTDALQDAMVTTTTPWGQRVSICTCTRTGRHLATFTRRPRLSLYTLATEPPQVAASAQVSASGPVAPPCSCRLLSHQTLLWHHRLGHPSLPRLCGMHSRLLVSVEGRQHAAPHSSSFPLTTAPQQTLHVDVWGPARVSGQGRERYFVLVVDDYTRYTTVFPLRSKGEVPDVLIPWVRAVCLQLRERLREDLPVLRLHSDRGGEFSSDLLRDFVRGEGILQSFSLLAFPQKNGIAERRIGLVMEVARTSMIHVVAPLFLWPFALRYAAHKLNLWPHVSLLETSPTLGWTGKVGDGSVFRVWGSRAFVRDTSPDKLSARAIPGVFLGFPPDTRGRQFYQPTLCRVLPSQDVTFDELVPFYRLLPYRSAPLPPLQLFLAPGPPLVDPLLGTVPIEVAVDSGAARGAAFGGDASRGATSGGAEPAGAEREGAESEGARSGGAELGGAELAGAELGDAELEGAEPGDAEPEGAEPGGAESEGAASGGAEPRGTAFSGGALPRLSPRPEPLSPEHLHNWFAWRTRLRSGATGAGVSAARGTGAGGTGATSLGGVGVLAGEGGPGGARAAGLGGACTTGTGAAGAGGAVGTGAGGAGAGDHGAGGARAVDPGAGGAGAGGVAFGGTGAAGVVAGDHGVGDIGGGGAGHGGAGAVGAGAGDT